MRLGLFVTVLGIVVLSLFLLMPVPPTTLPLPTGQIPPPPIAPRCLALTYSGALPLESLPSRLELLPQSVGARYQGRGDGDPHR